MEEKSRSALKILTFVIGVLVFAVAVFAFFTFSENDFVENTNRFRNIIAANLSMPEKSSSGYFEFTQRSDKPAASSDGTDPESSDSDGTDSESSDSDGTDPESGMPRRSSGESAQSSAANPASSSGSASVPQERSDKVPIMGKAVLTKAQLLAYSERNRANMRLTCSLEDLIGYYLSVGAQYGVRGDIAYLQAINETGWFKFNRPNSYLKKNDKGEWVRIYEPRPEGLYVKPEDNNFCGLGVTGMYGGEESLCRFATAELGVTAHIQHLYAYACKNPLPAGKAQVDRRFSLVDRGCAPYWCDLSNKWAMTNGYGEGITATYYAVLEKY